MKLEWPKEKKFRPSDMIRVKHNGAVIGLLKEINEHWAEVVVPLGRAVIVTADDKVTGCEIVSEPEDYCEDYCVKCARRCKYDR